ncbi:MAG: DUF362 domain-containing protein [Sphaerochaetaceae bacterium]
MSKVAITKCDTYDQGKVDQAVALACQNSDFPIVKDKIVLLKPNILSDAKADQAITTNPAVVRAAIHFLRQNGAKQILLGDSPGIQGPAFVPRNSGMSQLCFEESVQWVDFTKDTVTHLIPGTKNISLPLPRILEKIDVLISLPKFKTHQLMYATGAVKNQFGLVPGLHKSPCHVLCPARMDFASLIVGINLIAKPSFALMDGIVGMEGAGPANGTPRHVGLILASNDCVAVDFAEATIMGYNPLSIPIVKQGLKRHLGEFPSYTLLDAKDLVIKDFQRINQETEKSQLFANLILPILTRPYRHMRIREKRMAPQFESSKCILCQRCIQICPADALTVKDKQIVINTHSCVRCYCCHEVCPANAITIGKR